MKKSYNALQEIILYTQSDQDTSGMLVKAGMRAKLTASCSVTGYTMLEIDLSTSEKHHSVHEALRRAVETFINGKFTISKMSYHDVRSESIIDLSVLHHIDYDCLQEPFRSMFKDLFSSDQWKSESLMLKKQNY